jgi:hypothetical protein
VGQRAAEWKGLDNRTFVYIRQRQVDAVVVTLAEAIGTGVDPVRGRNERGLQRREGAAALAAGPDLRRVHFAADPAVFVTTTRLRRPSEPFAVQHSILAVHRDYLGLWNNRASLLSLSEVNGRGQGDSQPPRIVSLAALE